MTDRRIVILGFMACGKTTVAQELARQLNCRFIDLDSFINEREGRSPAQIISEDGEAVFRDLETLALRDVLQESGARVIALGGGTWTIPANRTLVALHDCLSLWLDAPFDLCWERIASSQTIRPLAPDRTTALSKYESRCGDYGLAERTISISASVTAETVAEQILREI
jgi:shikimate kinase